MATRGHPESEVQQDIVRFLRSAGMFPMAVPNGAKIAGTAKQRAMRVAYMKKEGMVAGAPDLIVFGKQGRVGTIEVKAKRGTARQTQKDCQERLEAMGHHYALCRSVNDVKAALVRWGWMDA